VVPSKEKRAWFWAIARSWPLQNAQFLGAKLPAKSMMVAIVPSILMDVFLMK
jgi:hypothetical protein